LREKGQSENPKRRKSYCDRGSHHFQTQHNHRGRKNQQDTESKTGKKTDFPRSKSSKKNPNFSNLASLKGKKGRGGKGIWRLNVPQK